MQNKKIKRLIVGTNNSGKLKEIRDLLPKNVKIHSTSEFKLKSPRENGKTNLICLADDSGLEIDILKKKPGIFSARWAGKNLNFNKAIKKVYKELKKKDKNWETKKIKARFICALSICYLNKKIACEIGKVEGNISPEPKGDNGFGYDPIFIPLNKKLTFGEMKLKTKYKIDHRYKAYKKIKKFF